MLNEGIIVNDTAALLKSEVLNQIRRLGPSTADQLERAVFHALVGHDREDVDWRIEDNQAGYYTWVRSFDQIITELIEDGYIRTDETHTLVPTEAEPLSKPSSLVSPPAGPPVTG
jgi:hypothetical protein